MRAAQAAADHLPAGASISLAGYLTAQDGGLLVDGEGGRRWMATPFFEERAAQPGDRFTPSETCAYRLPE
eukprot:15448247-Alexandrium_andersonii.AAC.1